MPRSSFSLLNLLVVAVGAGLLAFTIRQVGWDAIVSGITSLGWGFLAVLVLGVIRVLVRAFAWVACVDVAAEGQTGRTLPLRDAFGAMLSADALGNLTPLGLLASEPAKVLLARGRVSTVTSVASVAIENLFYTVSVMAVLLAGTWMLLQRANAPPALEKAAEAVVLAAAAAGVVGVWAARTRPAVLTAAAPFVARLAGRSAAPADAMIDVEARLYGVLRWPLLRLAHVGLWEALFHAAAVAEVWLVLRLLPGGGRTGLTEAFLMESAGRFVTVAFKFIPYRLGVDEAGSGAVAQVLGLNPAVGVTLALVRRLRILVLNAVGLALLVRRR